LAEEAFSMTPRATFEIAATSHGIARPTFSKVFGVGLRCLFLPAFLKPASPFFPSFPFQKRPFFSGTF